MARSGKLTVLKVAAIARAKRLAITAMALGYSCKSAALGPPHGYSATG